MTSVDWFAVLQEEVLRDGALSVALAAALADHFEERGAPEWLLQEVRSHHRTGGTTWKDDSHSAITLLNDYPDPRGSLVVALGRHADFQSWPRVFLWDDLVVTRATGRQVTVPHSGQDPDNVFCRVCGEGHTRLVWRLNCCHCGCSLV